MSDEPPVIVAPATVVAPPVVTVASQPAQVGDKNIAPTTTAAEDETKLGQRKINLLWEWTQATLAVVVTTATLFVAARLALKDQGDNAAFLLLSNAFFSVIATYLSRTNHTKTGGVQAGDTGR